MAASLILLLLFMISLLSLQEHSLVSGSDYIKKSIGPLADCTGSAEPLAKFVKTCHNKCMRDSEPKRSVKAKLHQSNAVGPNMIECIKIRRQQTFTETWTFSTIRGPVKSKLLPITREECHAAIADNCPDFDCNHRETDELKPEYHYGSDTTVTEVVVSLITMPSIIMYKANDIYLTPLSSDKQFPLRDQFGHDGYKNYLWKQWGPSNKCPFEFVKEYGCDEYRDDGTYYMCAGGGFSITPTDDVAINTPTCAGLKVSKEGFVYSLWSVDPIEETAGRLGITEEKKLEADDDFLRHKIQQITSHLDAEICANQCEILSLEMRLSNRESSLMRIGNEHLLVFSNGTGVACRALSGCRLPDKKLFCGNPPRIGVVCTTMSGLWNPEMSYIDQGDPCYKPDELEFLFVSFGSERYLVDYDLMVSVPLNYSHGVYPTGYASLHMSGVQLDVKTLKELKDPWATSKSGADGISLTSKTSSHIESPHLAIGKAIVDMWDKVTSFVSSVEHAIGLVVIILMVIVAIWIIRFLIKVMSRRTERVVKKEYTRKELLEMADDLLVKNRGEDPISWE
ncbi:glycoprotein [Wuhan Insect virus 6]|uniref:Glycoprotein n=1 Tax=Wuhan Insect virus 6 TaxID=1608111 RepID=A0A0B5KKA3_9RHAB|nr:glycoprotein [Wuhan Insect virus 6]AJG39190.1 glycoprotein [Wuhan Insect virus 6]